MKKSFWGYNVQEVDTNMELLESAKAKLEKKVKSLTEELDSAREELKETKESLAIGSSTNSGELERKYREAEKKIELLKREVDSLTKKNQQMAIQISSYDEQSMKKAVEQAGDICRAAYEDMANAKINAKEVLEQFLEHFWERFNQYEQKINDIYENMIHSYEAGREGFLLAADEILTSYTAIREQNETMNRKLEEVKVLRSEVQKEMNAVLGELNAQDGALIDEEASSIKEKTEEEKSDFGHIILNELTMLRKEHQKTEAKKHENSIMNRRLENVNEEIQQEEKVELNEGKEEVQVDVTMNVDKKNIV